MPTTDYTGLFKGLLRDHLGLPIAAIESAVFAKQVEVKAIDGLTKRSPG